MTSGSWLGVARTSAPSPDRWAQVGAALAQASVETGVMRRASAWRARRWVAAAPYHRGRTTREPAPNRLNRLGHAARLVASPEAHRIQLHRCRSEAPGPIRRRSRHGLGTKSSHLRSTGPEQPRRAGSGLKCRAEYRRLRSRPCTSHIILQSDERLIIIAISIAWRHARDIRHYFS